VATLPLFRGVACELLARAVTLQTAAPCEMIVAVALIPIGFASAAGTFGTLVQTGGLTLVPIAAKLERLNPFQGLARILSRETLAHSLRASLAFGCATLAICPALFACAATMMRAGSAGEIVATVWSAAQQVAAAAAAVGLVFSLAEYGAARNAWLRKLRMSFEERKREQKEEEGDAVARGRRRALHRSLLRGGVARINEAAFVVVNPTHVAVALAYAPPRVSVPEILVRAAGDGAAYVRLLAQRHRIPIVEDAALARALYRDGRSGEPIPHALYVAVAELVVALMRSEALVS
jgi:flagellar biosynthesis protein FlhB